MKQYFGKILLLALIVCITFPVVFGEVLTKNIDYDDCNNKSLCSEAIQGGFFTSRDTNCGICWRIEIAGLFIKTLKLAGALYFFLCLLTFILQTFRGHTELVSRPLSLITLKIRLNP